MVANEIFNNLIELSEDCFDSIVKHGGGQGGYFCILKWDSRIYVAAENKGLYAAVEINSVVYTFGFCLKTRLSSYSALSRMSIDTGNPLCS